MNIFDWVIVFMYAVVVLMHIIFFFVICGNACIDDAGTLYDEPFYPFEVGDNYEE